jgi:hypothetical protein
MIKYGAIPSVINSGKYLVAELNLHGCGANRVLGDVRAFASFKEADDCARRIANGEFPDLSPAGEYVSMR